MARFDVMIRTEEVPEEHIGKIAEAVSLILRLSGCKRPVTEGAFWGRTPADDVPIKGDEVTLTVHDETTTLAPAAEEKPKAKRKRRTKAQIAAAEAAKEAAAPVVPNPTGEVPLVPEDAFGPAEVVEIDPLSDVEYTELDVKAAVVKEVERLTEAGYDSPTRAVVEKLVVLTGKPKVSEIDASLYAKVIFGLSSS